MTLRAQIITLFLSVLIGTIALLGALQYLSARQAQLNDVNNQLNSIAEAKRQRLNGIVRKRQEQIIMLQLRESIRTNFASHQQTGNTNQLLQIEEWLRETRDNLPSFKEVHLLSLEGKVIASSAPEEFRGADFSKRESFLRAKAGEQGMHEFFYNQEGKLRINLAGTLSHLGKEIGIVVITTDAEDILSIVNDYTGLGETGETTLAARDSSGNAVYLTPTRFFMEPGKVLVVPLEPQKAMTQALAGNEEYLEMVLDYRNVLVVAAPRFIEATGWGLTTKIDRDEALSPVRQLLRRTLLLTLLLIVVVTALAYYFSGLIIKPILDLCHVSWEIAEGNVEKRIDYSSKNEVGHLAENFNLMADKLVETNREVSEKLEELDRVNESLNRFSYVVSHDLKSPLAALEALMQHIRDDLEHGDSVEVNKMLGMAEDKVHHMQGLITAILQYSMTGAGEQEQVKLQVVVHDVVKQLEVPEHVQVVVNSLPEITIERVLIVQVFQNLIGNAIKYLDKPNGRVEVNYQQTATHHQFSISDNGSGIERKNFDKIFDLFNKVNRKKEVDSSGIGLSIVKKIIETKYGRIWVESEVGAGSTFYFTLPLKSRRS